MAVVALAVGIPTGFTVGTLANPLVGVAFGVAEGWAAGSIAFLLAVYLEVRGFDAGQTRSHATLEDPGRRILELICLAASGVSVFAVIGLMAGTGSTSSLLTGVIAAAALLSVAASWTLIHVVYTLAYARLYYTEPVGGIDFPGTDAPRYPDFAYASFGVGMTYQVSDFPLQTTELRRMVLGHTLISYFFGAVVLATVINLTA